MADGSPIIVARALSKNRRKPKKVADMFCGAGGLSTGAARALKSLGMEMELHGINHWPVAIETNKRNHPEHAERIRCAKLETALPLDHVPEGYLDLLLAAPSCVFHSPARGGRPVHDQQRMDPWHVVRWCTELRVKRLLIENVPAFMDWGPCDIRTQRPIKSRKGEYFRAWIAALKAIGFRLMYDVLCAADYGDAQERRRFILIGCSDGRPLRWPEPMYAPKETTDLLGNRKKWRGAEEIIDWTRRGTSIFNRKKPLAPNTLRRIRAGAVRYGWPQPYVDALDALLEGREPVLDIAFDGAVDGVHEQAANGQAAPLMIHLRGTHEHAVQNGARSLDEPLPTLTAGGSHVGLVMATASGGAARALNEPLPTIVGGGNGARPHFITPLLMGTQGNARARSVEEPAPTITTGGASSEKRPGNARPQLVEPLIISRNGFPNRDARPVSQSLYTVTTRGAGYLAEPLIVPLSNSSSAGTPRVISEPLRTITTAKGGDMALAAPLLLRAAHGDSDGRDPGSRVLDPREPLPTITGSNEFAVAEPVVEGIRIDIHYRMLHWRELSRATSFDDEGEEYDFAGNATEITKQIGNAVPCRMGKALVRALMEDAA